MATRSSAAIRPPTTVGRIAVTEVGEGPALLFVHVGSWRFIWRDLLVALSPHHHRVALDAPGAGHSSHPAQSRVSLEMAAAAVGAVGAATRATLTAIHCLAAAILIPGLRQTQ